MQDNNDQDTGPPESRRAAAPSLDPQLPSIARRRALLKGLSKGAALAGAAVPLRSLATGDKPAMKLHNTTDGKDYLCTVSGNVSVLHSVAAPTTACAGKNFSYYKKDSSGNRPTWPKDGSGHPICKVGSISRTPSDSFYTCFGGGSTGTSIGSLVDTGSPTSESYWVAALLNANVMSNFPYSSAEVVSLYQSSNQTSALAFFQSYLST